MSVAAKAGDGRRVVLADVAAMGTLWGLPAVVYASSYGSMCYRRHVRTHHLESGELELTNFLKGVRESTQFASFLAASIRFRRSMLFIRNARPCASAMYWYSRRCSEWKTSA